MMNKNIYIPQVSYVLVVAVVGIILGLASVALPLKFIVAFFSVPLFILLAWKFSEYAVFLLVLVLVGVVPVSYLPKLSISGGTLRAEDLGLIFLFIVLIVKNSFLINLDKNKLFQGLRPYLVPLLGFLFFAFLSALMAVLFKTAPIKDVLTESRPYLAWLILPILFMSINTLEKFQLFKKMIVLLAVLLSLIVVFESFTGISLSDKGQEVRALWTSGEGAFRTVNRSTTPGIFIMAAVLVYLVAMYSLKGISTKYLSLYIALGFVILMGVIVGFGRGIWLSIIVSILMLFFISDFKRYLSLMMWVFLCGALFIILLYLVKPDYVEAVSNRFFSVSNEVSHGTSLGRRFIENEYALIAIEKNPLFGIGLGGHYKPPTQESAYWPAEVRYIHNEYLNILTKLGIFGLLFALYLVVTMFKRVFHVYKDPSSDKPLVFAAFSLFLSSTVITAFTQPNLVSTGGVVSIAIAMFMVESLYIDGHKND